MAWVLEDEPQSASKGKWVLEEEAQPTTPLTPTERTTGRLAKNIGAGLAGRLVDAGPLLPATLGQLAVRLPAWGAQGTGYLANKLGDVTGIENFKKLGDISSMAGEMANREIEQKTKQITGQPFFSTLGLVNQAAEAAIPELAPQTQKEQAADAAIQTLMGGRYKNPWAIAGSLTGAGGMYKAVETGDPRWVVAGLAAPVAIEAGAKGLTRLAAKKASGALPGNKITKQIIDLGVEPSTTPEEMGGNLAQVTKDVKKDILPVKEQVSKAVGSNDIPVSPNFVDDIKTNVGLAGVDQRILDNFDKDLASKLRDDVVTGGFKISFDDLQDLKAKYGDVIGRSSAPKAAVKDIYSQIHSMEMNAANQADEAINMAKFNKIYREASDIERNYINPSEPSKTFNNLHKQFIENPITYAKEVAVLPGDIRSKLVSMHMRELGGGADFNYGKWGKNVKNLDPKSIELLSGGDPVKAANILKIANKAANLDAVMGFIEKTAGAAGYAAGGGYQALQFQRALSSKGATSVLDKLLDMPKNLNLPAKTQLVNQLLTTLQEEGLAISPEDIKSSSFESEQKGDAGSDALSGGETQQEIKGGALDDIIKKYGFKHREPKKAPANAKIIKGMIKSESGGDPNAKNPVSTASGILQYTTDTWKSAINLHKDLGFTEKDKDNPKAQIAMTHRLIEREYKPALTKAKIPVTPGTIYAMHHFGQGNAINFLKNKNSYKAAYKMFPKDVVRDNRNVFFEKGKPRSARGLYSWLQKRVH